MIKQFTALLWKEWREGWTIMTALWGIAAVVGVLSRALANEEMQRSIGFGFLCFASALAAARLFSSEGETGTIGFLMRQPVKPTTVWGLKLLMGAIFVAALYLLWFAAERPESSLLMHIGSKKYKVIYNPQLMFIPLLSFSMAFFLSTILDNTMLAFVGGVVLTVGYGMFVGLLLKLAAYRVESPIDGHVYFGGYALLAWLGGAVLFLALSRLSLRFRTVR